MLTSEEEQELAVLNELIPLLEESVDVEEKGLQELAALIFQNPNS